MKGSIRTLNRSGDTATVWDTEDPQTVKDAEATFNELVDVFHNLAFVPGPSGKAGTQIKEFDPTVKEIVVTPPMVGG